MAGTPRMFQPVGTGTPRVFESISGDPAQNEFDEHPGTFDEATGTFDEATDA